MTKAEIELARNTYNMYWDNKPLINFDDLSDDKKRKFLKLGEMRQSKIDDENLAFNKSKFWG